MTKPIPHNDEGEGQQSRKPEIDPWENYIGKNEDHISKPSLGRFFPVSVLETIRLIRSLEFAKPHHRKRVDITFLNSTSGSSEKTELVALYPAQEIIVFSFSKDISQALAKSLFEKALHEFAKIAKDETNGYAGTSLHSVRAYYDPSGHLIITRMRQRYTRMKYRGTSKFSNAFKAKGVRHDERVVCTIDIKG